ncbi:MAG: polyprenyl synthetase family protein [Alphaproteobacteria bacterium]|nr:polyprenyl synthetase family protein [Alphaproteobacteria bacterium]
MVLTVAQSPTLAAALHDTAAAIEDALDRLLPKGADAQERLYQAMRYSSMGGGKRLRGFLVVQGSALFNVSPRAALRVAAAVEMLHAYSLIHDDLPAMDDDDMRRGKPSCHKAFDEATAILAGDALQARAFEVLAEPDTHSDPAVRVELVRALAEAAGAHGMAGGQMIDLLAEHERLSEAEITRLQMLKTGRLLTFSAEAGAIMGKAALAQRHALAAYGRDLGLAFQIADDLLDATAEAETVGKATGKDATAGKATLVALLGVERARAQAALLAEQAAAHLDSFEARGDLLKDLVHHVVSRRA